LTVLGRNIPKKVEFANRIEFVCFSFHVGLLLINFSYFKPDIKNNAYIDAVSSKFTNFDTIQQSRQNFEVGMNVKVTKLGSL